VVYSAKTVLGSWGKPVPCGHVYRVGDPKVWSTVLITALSREIVEEGLLESQI
jgi:hypothetical protein